MVTFTWARYVETQLLWAEMLIDRADETFGHDPAALKAKAATMAAECSYRIGRQWAAGKDRTAALVPASIPMLIAA